MTTTQLTGVIADPQQSPPSTRSTPTRSWPPSPSDAYVNDARREIGGADAIRRWVEKEMVGDRVTMDVREVLDHHGDTIVRAAYDGEYDKTDLPDPLVMTTYFAVRDGLIVSLTIVFNQPSPY